MFILQISEPQDYNRRVYLHLVDSTDGVTAKTGQTGKAWLSKNGGTPAQTSGSLVEVSAANAPGLYYVQLTIGEISTPGWIQIRYKGAATLEFQDIGQIVAYDPYNASIGSNQIQTFDSGPDIDYKKIEKIVDKSVSKVKFPDFPKPEKVDLSGLKKDIAGVMTVVKGIKLPEPEKFDYSAILQPLEQLKKAILAIEIPEPEPVDLDPVITLLKQTKLEEFKAELEGMLDRIKDFFDGDIESFKATGEEILNKLNDMPYVVLDPKKPEDEEGSEEMPL